MKTRITDVSETGFYSHIEAATRRARKGVKVVYNARQRLTCWLIGDQVAGVSMTRQGGDLYFIESTIH